MFKEYMRILFYAFKYKEFGIVCDDKERMDLEFKMFSRFAFEFVPNEISLVAKDNTIIIDNDIKIEFFISDIDCVRKYKHKYYYLS